MRWKQNLVRTGKEGLIYKITWRCEKKYESIETRNGIIERITLVKSKWKETIVDQKGSFRKWS